MAAIASPGAPLLAGCKQLDTGLAIEVGQAAAVADAQSKNQTRPTFGSAIVLPEQGLDTLIDCPRLSIVADRRSLAFTRKHRQAAARQRSAPTHPMLSLGN